MNSNNWKNKTNQTNKKPHETVKKKLLTTVQGLTEYSALVLDEWANHLNIWKANVLYSIC